MFDGLFGLFNDSLPDGWGRLLQTEKAMQMGFLPDSLTPLDRLRFVGRRNAVHSAYESEMAKISAQHMLLKN